MPEAAAAEAVKSEPAAKAEAAKDTPPAPVADGQPAAIDAGKKPEAAKPAEAPAEVKYDLKVPEGADAAEVIAFAKEHKIAPEVAQKLLDREVAARASLEQSFVAKHAEQVAKWEAEAKADPEIGGAKFDANVNLAKRALARFASPDFVKSIGESGYGNHPELVRTFARIGAAMAEDKLVPSSNGEAPVVDRAKRLYPDMQ